ncbi:uncharacterized protein LOC123541281 [Mercenaria mercenaria]|uniref:uncharacterized protein LOC123541281 n=1 Tax=Mercenaria mercenaria TaxID=6596 RepID=UPI00234E8397|nr:uncharacterized protein LOC123541281 [Mercenaria mercenaria]
MIKRSKIFVESTCILKKIGMAESTPRKQHIVTDKCVLCSFPFCHIEITPSGEKVKHTTNLNKKRKLTADKIKDLKLITGVHDFVPTETQGICTKCYRRVESVKKTESGLKKTKQIIWDSLLQSSSNTNREVNVKTKLMTTSELQHKQVKGTEENLEFDMRSESSTLTGMTGAIPVTVTIKAEPPESAENQMTETGNQTTELQNQTTETCKAVKETSSKHFVHILANLRNSSDISICLICGKCTTVVKANKCLLEASSPEFSRVLKLNSQKQPLEAAVLELDNMGFLTADFVKLIDFIYTGKITLTLENLENILRIAGYFKIQALINLCEEYLKSVLNNDNCVQLFLVLCKNDTAVMMKNSLGGVKKALKEYIGLYVRGLIKDCTIFKYSNEDIIHLLRNNCLTELKDADTACQFAKNMLDHCPGIQHHRGMEDYSQVQTAAKAAEMAITFLLEDLETMFLPQKKSLCVKIVSLQNKAQEQLGIADLFEEALTKLSKSLGINCLSPKHENGTDSLVTPVTLSASSQIQSDKIKIVLSPNTSGKRNSFANDNKNEDTAACFIKEGKMKTLIKKVGGKGVDSKPKLKNGKTKGGDGLESSNVEEDLSGIFETLAKSSFEKLIPVTENDSKIYPETSVRKIEQVIDSGNKSGMGEFDSENLHVVIENVKVEPEDPWTQNTAGDTATVEENETVQSMHALENTDAFTLFRSETDSFDQRQLQENRCENLLVKGYSETQIKVEKVNDDGTIDHIVIQSPVIPTVVKPEQPDEGYAIIKQEQQSVNEIPTNKSISYVGCNVPVEQHYSGLEKRKKTAKVAKLPVTTKKRKYEEQKQNKQELVQDHGHKSECEGQTKDNKSGPKVMLIPKSRLKKVVKKSEMHKQEEEKPMSEKVKVLLRQHLRKSQQ